MNELFEDTATLLVVLELVEAGAGRGQEHQIAGPRRVRGNFHGALNRPSALDGHAASNLLFNFFGCRADQQGENGLFTQRPLQQRVIAAFVFPAKNDQDSPGKSIQGLQRGIDVGRFRIVVMPHAADFRDELEAMLDACERAHSFCDSGGTGPGEARRHYGRKDVLNVVCARERNLLETQYRLFPAVMAKNNLVFPHESALGHALLPAEPVHVRSEEHTSELQSPDHLVCRLLLEKKKKTMMNIFTEEQIFPHDKSSSKRFAVLSITWTL